eukprot:249095-Chlamydomonas_euryale.AAC.1
MRPNLSFSIFGQSEHCIHGIGTRIWFATRLDLALGFCPILDTIFGLSLSFRPSSALHYPVDHLKLCLRLYVTYIIMCQTMKAWEHWMDESLGTLDGWMDAGWMKAWEHWMDGWMLDGWMKAWEHWMDGWMDA